jgi:two-component system chemotaxis response regulator CheB
MMKRNIIVIGASAGGFNVLRQVVAGLAPGLDASIFIVWHMSPDIRGVLPDVLNKLGTVPAKVAHDKDPILANQIYVAAPDLHLMVEKDRVRTTRGPKENRFRPAVDPLFRSAAQVFGPRVIGVVLTGALDDGTAGLWAVKHFGGLAVVQDPVDAEFSSMPRHAINAVEVDHIVPAAELGALLTKLCDESIPVETTEAMTSDENIKLEVDVALQDNTANKEVLQFGPLSSYTCPECHGVLSAIDEDGRVRYRCHTGHAFSADSLLTLITEKIESSLWSAIRGVEESLLLLNSMGDHYAAMNEPGLAAAYFKKAKEAHERLSIMHRAIWRNEQLSEERINEMAWEANGKMKPPRDPVVNLK